MKNVLHNIPNLIVGLLIFAGVPLLGWGVKDLHGFFQHPARSGYIILTLIAEILIVLLVPNVGKDGGAGRETVRRQRIVIVLLQIFPLLLVFLSPWADRRGFAVIGNAELFRYIGLILFVIGIAGMHWAEAVLGAQFSVHVAIQKNHRLITHGPYKILRHPRYLGILLFTSGIALIFRSWIGLLCVSAILAVLVWRIYDEESLMHQEFGVKWDAYVQKTWRLIPFVY